MSSPFVVAQPLKDLRSVDRNLRFGRWMHVLTSPLSAPTGGGDGRVTRGENSNQSHNLHYNASQPGGVPFIILCAVCAGEGS